MKYIASTDRGWDHKPYWDYLVSAKQSIPPHIFEFAFNSENYDLTSPNSLHDAWLESWNVEEQFGIPKRGKISIRANFLGPQHDRHISLVYRDVLRHEIQHTDVSPDLGSGHGDLLIYELRALEGGTFEHEMFFSRGFTFLVEFRDLAHHIILLKEVAS